MASTSSRSSRMRATLLLNRQRQNLLFRDQQRPCDPPRTLYDPRGQLVPTQSGQRPGCSTSALMDSRLQSTTCSASFVGSTGLLKSSLWTCVLMIWTNAGVTSASPLQQGEGCDVAPKMNSSPGAWSDMESFTPKTEEEHSTLLIVSSFHAWQHARLVHPKNPSGIIVNQV